MLDKFKSIKPHEINSNAFQMVGSDWMLVTAGGSSDFNTMTASWGGFGVIWNKPVCWCVIRPQRFTYQFTEKSDIFTLSFFEEKHRNALKYCGTHSGRDGDKMMATGLTPISTSLGSVAFEQARVIMECRKVYFQDLIPEQFLDDAIHKEYPKHDYHRMYFGEIVDCLTR